MFSFTSNILENSEKKLVVEKLLCVLNYVRGDFSPLEFDVLAIVHKWRKRISGFITGKGRAEFRKWNEHDLIHKRDSKPNQFNWHQI